MEVSKRILLESSNLLNKYCKENKLDFWTIDSGLPPPKKEDVLRWFRKDFNIDICIDPTSRYEKSTNKNYKVFYTMNNEINCLGLNQKIISYEKAQEELITLILKRLIYEDL